MGNEDNGLSPRTKSPDDSVGEKRLANVGIDYINKGCQNGDERKPLYNEPADSGSSKTITSALKYSARAIFTCKGPVKTTHSSISTRDIRVAFDHH